MKKSNENWKQYLNNKSATRRPKLFNITFKRDEQGNIWTLGGQSLMLDRSKNSEKWVRMNSRAVAALINENGVNAL